MASETGQRRSVSSNRGGNRGNRVTVEVLHGSRTKYFKHGCRCDLCTEAMREYVKDWAARRARGEVRSYVMHTPRGKRGPYKKRERS